MTRRHQETIYINRPIEEVFDFAVNPANTPKWQRFLLSAEPIGDAPLGKGSKLSHERAYYFGMRFKSIPEIVEYEENRRYRAEDHAVAGGPFTVDGGMTFEPHNGGTNLTYFFILEPNGKFRFKPLELMVGTAWLHEARNDFKNLKRVMEAEPATAPA